MTTATQLFHKTVRSKRPHQFEARRGTTDFSESEQALGPLAADLASAAFTLARRFASGGTMWCWAPHAAEHAQHIAVEFVHPVIMGKPALPAVAVTPDDADALASLRLLARAGDVIAIVGEAEGHVPGVLRRAPSWGATTIWIGAGARPEAGQADHVLWMGDDGARATHDGRFVLAYHLLWELTHVCLEHQGLLAEPAVCEGPTCTTCSDEGRLAEVVDAAARTAIVRTATGIEHIDTSLVGDVVPGDLLLVHAGAALTIVEDGP